MKGETFMFKKNSHRIMSLLLAVVMMMSLSATAFAAEVTPEDSNGIPENAKVVHTETFYFDPSGEDENAIAPCSWESGSFTFALERRGADYQMDGNYMAYEVTCEVDSGTFTGDVGIQLRTYDFGYSLSHIRVPVNGQTVKEDWIAINPYSTPSTYYFIYTPYRNALDDGIIKVTMVFYSWSA